MDAEGRCDFVGVPPALLEKIQHTVLCKVINAPFQTRDTAAFQGGGNSFERHFAAIGEHKRTLDRMSQLANVSRP
jgi:hypothetical protein